jgi:hypothetical protein
MHASVLKIQLGRTEGRNLKLSSPSAFAGRGLIINTNRNKEKLMHPCSMPAHHG